MKNWLKKEKSSVVIQGIVLATAVFNVVTAGLNLAAATGKALSPGASPAAAPTQTFCPTPAAPQVIQYLNVGPPQAEEKEPSRPGGQ